MFEFVTDELQSNRINISRVYPAITFLKNKLENSEVNYEYTAPIRESMLKSFKIRFDSLINEKVFVISTFLDHNFEISYFLNEDQGKVKARILAL